MVPRRLSRHRRPVAVATVLIFAFVLAAPSLAANRRISISHYRWSDPDIHINLGEHVTWYWIGPDTMHSITGSGANDASVDSDPGTDTPRHDIGDSFKAGFDAPGVYSFHCKLHPFVRGTVTVSAVPGDPDTEPDPVPQSNIDLTPPYIDGVHLAKRSFDRTGTTLEYGSDERATLDAEIYRVGRHHLRFAGWRVWKQGHVGYNRVHFGSRSPHFDADPGRYRAFVRATDASHNESRTHRLRFSIR